MFQSLNWTYLPLVREALRDVADIGFALQTMGTNFAMNEKRIKQQIIRQLPPEAFQRNPRAAWLLLPIMAVLTVGHLILLFATPAWFLAVPIAFIVGSTQLTLWSFAHEAAHGTMLKHKGFRRLCTNLAGFFYLYPGELLERWHQAHHRHTNQEGWDPDIVTVDQFHRAEYRWFRALMQMRIVNNFVYFLCSNTVHANVVLWIRSDELKVFANDSWRYLRCKMIVISCIWLAVCLSAGPVGAFCGFVLPWLIANTLWASYAVTNHQTSCLTEKPDIFNTTISLKTLRIFEWLHLNGCHHVEHHLFPRMNWRYLPLVRKALRGIAGDRYRVASHGQAALEYLSTPLFYLNRNTKSDPEMKRIVCLESSLNL